MTSHYTMILFCIIGYIVVTVIAITVFNKRIAKSKSQPIVDVTSFDQTTIPEQYSIEQEMKNGTF